MWRICTGCSLGYESGPVLRFTLTSSAKPRLKLPARIYSGYPVIASVSGGGLPDGTEVTIERLRGGAWSRVATDHLISGVAEPTISLARGSQRVRVTAAVGSQSVISAEVRRTVHGTNGPRTRVTQGSYRQACRRQAHRRARGAVGGHLHGRHVLPRASRVAPGPRLPTRTSAV